MKIFTKTHIKTHIKTYLKTPIQRCSIIALTSLLTLSSTVAFAQSDVSQHLNTDKKSVSALIHKQKQTENQTSVVYLNNSSVEQLLTLKGIGQKRAQAIIAYREQVGEFKSVTDITKIKGIGTKILNDNKKRLQI